MPPTAAEGANCNLEAVPFQSMDPDPESDVIAFLSSYAWRYICEECRLSDVGWTGADSSDEMAAHFDVHRAAGHRVPDDYYEAVIGLRYWDETIRTTYCSRFRAEDENLTVRRLTGGEGLHCFRCVLNSGRTVKCFSTEQMLQHLDEHRTWGLPVPQHAYEKLALDRAENDELFSNYFEQRGGSAPLSLQYEPSPLLLPWIEMWNHRDGLDMLSSMLTTAISHFEGPLSESDQAAGWTEALCHATADVLRRVLQEVEVAKRDQGIDFWGADWERLCTNWSSDIGALKDRLRGSRKAPFDPPYEALDDLRGIIFSAVMTGGMRRIEWLLERPRKRRS